MRRVRLAALVVGTLAAGPAGAAGLPNGTPAQCLRALAAADDTDADAPDAQAAYADLARCPGVPEARLQQCLLAAHGGSRATAESCPAALAEWPPLAAEAHVAAGLRAWRDHDAAAARPHFESALKLDPNLAPARVALVVLADAAGDKARAREQARELVRRPGAVRCAANLSLKDDILRPASRALADAIDRIDPLCDECQGSLAFLYARQAQARRTGLAERLWKAAEGALRVVLQRNPQDFDSRLTLGDTLRMLHDFKGQADLYEAGLALRADWLEGQIEAGQAWLELRNAEKALPLLERATQLDPKNAAGWARLGHARRMLSRKDAADALRRAIDAGDGRPETLVELGRALLDAGDVPGAQDAFRKAVVKAPDLAGAHYGLARTLQATGDAAGAEQALAAYKDAFDREQAKAQREEQESNLARSTAAALDLLESDQADEARRQLDRAIAGDAKFEFIPFARAAIALRAGKAADPADLDAVVALCRAANPDPGAKK